jgi:hypothetical protein
VPRFELTNFQTEAVGAKVNGGEEGLGLHERVGDRSAGDYVTFI